MSAAGRPARILTIGLACLWIFDGLLQLQPAMFTHLLVSYLWLPVARGNPAWLADAIRWSIGFARPWLVGFNALVAGTQLAIGVLLLTRRPRLVRAGLWASVLFGLAVWVFGEGMSGLLAGGGTLADGVPGSALLYSLGAAALLIPPDGWRRFTRWFGFNPLQAIVALILFVGAFWQLAAENWTPMGLSAPPAGDFMMPQPQILRAALSFASGVIMRAPITVNAALISAMAVAGVLVLFAINRTAVCVAVLALIAAVWIVGQDAGMIFSGTATDPNTMPLIALFVAASWAEGRPEHARSAAHGRRRPTLDQAHTPA